MKSGRGIAWYRGRFGFAVSVALIASLFALVLVGVHVMSQKPSGADASSDFVTFNCHPSWNDESFSLVVDVDLTDGMNQGEAVCVANALFENTMGQEALHQFKSAEVDELGVWKVELTWGYSVEDLGHWFEAVIDPCNRAIVYNRCR